MGKKKYNFTTQTFIEAARKIYGNNYDYSRVNFIRMDAKVCVICHEKDENGVEHGEFWTTPYDFLKGHGCKKCGFKRSHDSHRYTTEIFVNKANEVHNGKYIYTKTNFIDSKTKVCVICPEHGEFWVKPNSHIQGRGCPKCGDRAKGLALTKTIEKFIEESRAIFGDKYIYTESIYRKANLPIDIICPIHGKFTTTPSRHINNKCGCPKCAESQLEREIRVLLESNKINYTYEQKFDWLKFKKNLSLDFYLPEYNIAIECQGEQHFKGGWSISEEVSCRVKERDEYKRNLCKENGVGLVYFLNPKFEKFIKETDYTYFIKSDDLLNYIKEKTTCK